MESAHLGKQEWLKARAKVLTSTDMGILLGVSPYDTKLGLWYAKKSGIIQEIPQTDRMENGTHFEPSIAELIAVKNNLQIKPFKAFISDSTLRIGSSFDFQITSVFPDSLFFDRFRGLGSGLLEIKSVDPLIYRDNWDEHADTIPYHIEAQVQHQMLVSGLKWALVGVMVGLQKHAVFYREAKPAIHARLLREAKDFWASIDANTPPPIDFAKDGKYLKTLLGDASGDAYDATTDQTLLGLIDQFKAIVRDEEAYDFEKRKEVLKNRILHHVGNASSIVGNGFKITASRTKNTPEKTMTITPNDVGKTITLSNKREGYRQFRHTFKKDDLV